MASRLTSLYGSHSYSSPPLSRANSCITAASMPSPATLFALDDFWDLVCLERRIAKELFFKERL